MNEMSDEAFRVDQKHEGGCPLLQRVFIKPGFVGTGKTAISKQGGEVREDDSNDLCKGQYHGHIEVKSDFWIGKASSSEVIVVEEVVQFPLVFDCVNHRAFLGHQFEVLHHALIDTDTLEKPIKKQAKKEAGLVV